MFSEAPHNNHTFSSKCWNIPISLQVKTSIRASGRAEFIKEDREKMRDPEPCRIKHTEDTEQQTELIEENEENKELSEAEGINHFRTGKKTLSCSQTQKVLKKRRAKKSFTCTQCGTRLTNKQSLELHMRGFTLERNRTHVISAGRVSHKKENLHYT
ncbi:hypothetical protein G5714_004185 [Onychostoma macrolepis]|uniref:C2H2-type domain-containing protein n=1 Tax=Onychostoma macrolepis TaxID=369639 RepID=A0A7J6DBJ0_9TELE|nr:hypothetical protein G5714_004185 [Onychostoma macrolepis]